MKERIVAIIMQFLQPKEVTAGDAMVSFDHAKSCPANGKALAEAADYLQIGAERVYVYGGGGSWGVHDGGFANTTYIRCTGCLRKKVFQER